jgi:elongation factor G
VHGGKHHPVDSQEVSFITAGRKAVLDAFMKAGPILLEPIVNVQVTVPGPNVGDITGDLAQRRGRINDTQPQGGGMVAVSALVPLGEMSDYASRLKSLTGGEGAYGMESSHYEPVPPALQQKLSKQYRPSEES